MEVSSQPLRWMPFKHELAIWIASTRSLIKMQLHTVHSVHQTARQALLTSSRSSSWVGGKVEAFRANFKGRARPRQDFPTPN